MTVRDILKGILAYLKGMVGKDFLLASLVADPGLLVLLQGLQNHLEALFTNKPENDIYIIVARLPETAFLNLSGVFVRMPVKKGCLTL